MVVVIVGTDAILLGAETLRGVYPVETIATVGRICAEVRKLTSHFYFERPLCHITLYQADTKLPINIDMFQAERVYNQSIYFKKTVKHVGEPMSHLESIASSAVSSGKKS